MIDSTSSLNERKICVSVVVAIYNVEDYLEECLDSLVNQTMDGLEIIAVNDGSTDSSEKILKDYAIRYPQKIKAIHKNNGGLSDARNVGIERSEGEFIGFVDGDDWVDVSMFERLYKKATASQSDIVVCAFNRMYCESEKKYDNRYRVEAPVRAIYSDFEKSVIENPRLLYASRSYAWNKIYRRSFFLEGGHKFPVGQWFEDTATIYNLLLDAKKISCVFDGLYNYRVRMSGSITSSTKPQIFDIYKSCDAVIDYYSKNTDMSNELGLALEQVIQNHITIRFDLFSKGTSAREKVLALRYIKRAFSYLDSHFPGWRLRAHIKKRKRTKFLAYMYVFYPSHLKAIRKSMDHQIKEKRRVEIRDTKTETLQNYGFQILGDISSSLRAQSVTHFADFETLLGIVREGAFLSHDTDLYVGIFADEFLKERIAGTMKDRGYVLRKTFRYMGKIAGQSYLVGCGSENLRINLNYYETTENVSRTYLYYPNPYVRYTDTNMRSVVEMSYSRIDSTKDIAVKGMTVPIPRNAEKTLEEKYGEDWRVRTNSGSYWQSPSAKTIDNVVLLEAD